MRELLPLLLEHPERFTRAEVPCCLSSFIDPPDFGQAPTPFPVVPTYGYSGPLRCSRDCYTAFHLRQDAIGSAVPGFEP